MSNEPRDVFQSSRQGVKESLQKNHLWGAVGNLISRTNLNRSNGDFIQSKDGGKDIPVAVKKSRLESDEYQYESRVPAKRDFLKGIIPNDDPDWVALQVKDKDKMLGTIMALRGGSMVISVNPAELDSWLSIAQKDKEKAIEGKDGLMKLSVADIRELDQQTQNAIEGVINQAITSYR